MRTTLVKYEDFIQPDYEDVATYYIKTAMGNYLYIHTKSRKAAQEFVDSEYGKGIYTIRASKNVVNKPHYDGFQVTARG